jgi:thiamine pyrophosphate-dependent acetolactate synthase large subunit-like protein
MDRARADTYPLARRAVVEALLRERADMLVVTGLGAPTWDATAAGDHALTFPLWGAMGAAAMVGLGLALAQPARRVLVLTGDGEMLMGLGALAAIAVERPANLSLVVLDNERYGETGMQPTHTAGPVDLAGMAAAAGWPVAATIADEAAFAAALPAILGAAGPVFHDVKVRAENLPLVMPPKDGAFLKDRFRQALLGWA